jgi:SAM-dependent methyltransferase
MHPYSRQFYDSIRAGSQSSAEAILPLVLQWVRPRSVVDVGCGLGTWLAVAKRSGVEEVLGLDGAYVDCTQLQISAAQFQPVDLNAPPPLARQFDLVLSLEVAEHLPPARAAAFVSYLTSLGPVVLFSAAVPYQLGDGHLNEQWPAYWAALFAEHGYVAVDCLRPRFWDCAKVEFWYAQNMLLYLQRTHPVLPHLLAETQLSAPPLALVHPELFLRECHEHQRLLQLCEELQPEHRSLREVLRWLPGLVQRALRKRLHRSLLPAR